MSVTEEEEFEKKVEWLRTIEAFSDAGYSVGNALETIISPDSDYFKKTRELSSRAEALMAEDHSPTEYQTRFFEIQREFAALIQKDASILEQIRKNVKGEELEMILNPKTPEPIQQAPEPTVQRRSGPPTAPPPQFHGRATSPSEAEAIQRIKKIKQEQAASQERIEGADALPPAPRRTRKAWDARSPGVAPDPTQQSPIMATAAQQRRVVSPLPQQRSPRSSIRASQRETVELRDSQKFPSTPPDPVVQRRPRAQATFKKGDSIPDIARLRERVSTADVAASQASQEARQQATAEASSGDGAQRMAKVVAARKRAEEDTQKGPTLPPAPRRQKKTKQTEQESRIEAAERQIEAAQRAHEEAKAAHQAATSAIADGGAEAGSEPKKKKRRSWKKLLRIRSSSGA